MKRIILILMAAVLVTAAYAETKINLSSGHRVVGKWNRETLADGATTVAHFLGRIPSKTVLPHDGYNVLGDEWETPDGRGWVWSLVVHHIPASEDIDAYLSFGTGWLGTAKKEPLASR